jgi:hypothetical protein
MNRDGLKDLASLDVHPTSSRLISSHSQSSIREAPQSPQFRVFKPELHATSRRTVNMGHAYLLQVAESYEVKEPSGRRGR